MSQSSRFTCGVGLGLAAEGDEEDGVVVAAGEDWTEEEEGACKISS